MAVSFTYWDDCVDRTDLEAMWMDPDVVAEWHNAGESEKSKIHFARDTDGQPYLTRTEMKAVAKLIVRRHFVSDIDSDMLCTIAELESNRQPLLTRYIKRTKEMAVGIMQITPRTVEWLARDLNYRGYEVRANPKLIYKPFVNIYFGAAYLTWLSTYDNEERSEEFMVRAYNGGTKMANHKSTLQYWRRYLAVKESLPSRKVFEVAPIQLTPSPSIGPGSAAKEVPVNITWDSRTLPEEMEEMWKIRSVRKEWKKSGEKQGKVRISHDTDKRPFLSRVELKAVADIIVSKHFSNKRLKPTIVCALAEIVNQRYLNGIGHRTGLMGLDYPTARWLYKTLHYRVYKVESVDDLTKPFVSIYFGTAYLAWLSEYGGRERTTQFVIQAYLSGPQNVIINEADPLWLKFNDALSHYEHLKKRSETCSIL